MKTIFVGLCLVFPFSTRAAVGPVLVDTVPIDVHSAISAENVYSDPKFQLSVKLPTGWSITQAIRWGKNNKGENTLGFKPSFSTSARPYMYYAAFYSGSPAPGQTPADVELWFMKVAQNRELARQKEGLAEYRNDLATLAFKKIGGRDTMSYFADFQQEAGRGRDRPPSPMLEHFLFVMGKEGFVMFFTKGSPKDVKKLVPQLEEMAASLKMP